MNSYPEQLKKTREYLEHCKTRAANYPQDPQMDVAMIHIKVLEYLIKIVEQAWEARNTSHDMTSEISHGDPTKTKPDGVPVTARWQECPRCYSERRLDETFKADS